ncbi:diiron oxygenase [Planomonospora sp. ID67723]|nr:diiron oxygenase [Planomonospora sp. ID67723]
MTDGLSWRPPPYVPESLLPGTPPYDPADPVENAVIRRLAGNWHRRAAVKHNAPLAEQQVVNAAFGLVLEGAYPGVRGESLRQAVAQAMVDEQYHTLMHLNASARTRRRRNLTASGLDLPAPYTVREHARLSASAGESWQRPCITISTFGAGRISSTCSRAVWTLSPPTTTSHGVGSWTSPGSREAARYSRTAARTRRVGGWCATTPGCAPSPTGWASPAAWTSTGTPGERTPTPLPAATHSSCAESQVRSGSPCRCRVRGRSSHRWN